MFNSEQYRILNIAKRIQSNPGQLYGSSIDTSSVEFYEYLHNYFKKEVAKKFASVIQDSNVYSDVHWYVLRLASAKDKNGNAIPKSGEFAIAESGFENYVIAERKYRVNRDSMNLKTFTDIICAPLSNETCNEIFLWFTVAEPETFGNSKEDIKIML